MSDERNVTRYPPAKIGQVRSFEPHGDAPLYLVIDIIGDELFGIQSCVVLIEGRIETELHANVVKYDPVICDVD